jgi:thiol-disulfide isomerase/thioredoxin
VGSTALENEIRETDGHGLEELLVSTDRLVVAEFYMEECSACRAMAPVLNDLAREMSQEAVFVRIDGRTYLDTALRYGVVATPTFLIFCRGTFLLDMVGVIHPALFRDAIRDMLAHRSECAGRPMTPPRDISVYE